MMASGWLDITKQGLWRVFQFDSISILTPYSLNSREERERERDSKGIGGIGGQNGNGIKMHGVWVK